MVDPASVSGRVLAAICVGPKRTATTWLHECLKLHPQLRLPFSTKETMYFDINYDKGWNWYWSHFHDLSGPQPTMEVGPSYFESVQASERIHAHNPNCLILATLRHPVERSFSLFLHEKRKGRIESDFETALGRHPELLDGSHYAPHLDRWVRLFGSRNVHPILWDDIVLDPETVLIRVFELLGVKNFAVPTATVNTRFYEASVSRNPRLARIASGVSRPLRRARLHGVIRAARYLGIDRVFGIPGKNVPVLSAETRARLAPEFDSDVHYVERMIGRRLDSWLK